MIAQMKHLDALIATQQTRPQFDGTVFEKMRLYHQKGPTKIGPLVTVFPDFS